MNLDLETVTAARHHVLCTCDPDTLEAPWKAGLCAVLHAEDHAAVRKLLDAFLSAEEASISQVLTRVRRVARIDTHDDATPLSYFGQALLRMTNNRWCAKPAPGTSQVFNYSRNLPAILEAETRNCLREDRLRGLLDGTTGVPGGIRQDRKATHVKKSRQLFEIEYRSTPADDELVAFHNERMRATRKDAARRSVLITKDDLRPLTTVSVDDPDLASDIRLSTIDETDLGARERSDKIAAITARCEQLDLKRERERARRLRRRPVQAADVARAYFAHHLDGDFPTRRELVDQLGITEPAARRELTVRLETVLELAREVFAQDRCGP